MNFVDYTTLIRDVLVNFTSLYFLAYVILYKKYQNVEMFVSTTLFNIFILIIVMAIARTDFDLAVGFGLFALLSLVQLRSAQFTKTEMAYLFGGVSLGVINGAGIVDFGFILICNFIVILSTWAIANWSLEHSANLIKTDNVKKMAISLDHIDESAIRDRAVMWGLLQETLGANIQTFEIKKIDYVREIIDVSVVYELPRDEIPKYADNIDPVPEFSPADGTSTLTHGG